jgi:HNH endonuclease
MIISSSLPSSQDRPRCQTPGCTRLCHLNSTDKRTGVRRWRKWCASCHSRRTASKHGLLSMKQVIAKNAGFNSVDEYYQSRAKARGFKSSAEMRNSTHRYLKYRLDYCENHDGRLGFRCTTTIMTSGQLDVDHIDGDPSNNDPGNLQTLCKCCHTYKTLTRRDWSSPGRKALGIKS